jgi:hypothetical protein
MPPNQVLPVVPLQNSGTHKTRKPTGSRRMNHAAGGLRMNRAKRDTTSYLRILYISRSSLRFNMASKVFVLNNLVISAAK